MKAKLLLIAISCILLVGCNRAAPSPVPEVDLPESIQGRIQRVENGLIAVTLTGEIVDDEPLTLTERMAYHHVPGVSIAVIENYDIE